MGHRQWNVGFSAGKWSARVYTARTYRYLLAGHPAGARVRSRPSRVRSDYVNTVLAVGGRSLRARGAYRTTRRGDLALPGTALIDPPARTAIGLREGIAEGEGTGLFSRTRAPTIPAPSRPHETWREDRQARWRLTICLTPVMHSVSRCGPELAPPRYSLNIADHPPVWDPRYWLVA